MSTDFFDNVVKEINSQMDKISSRVSEVFEIRTIKSKIEELVSLRKKKLMELGSLTFRKIEKVEDIRESDITNIIKEIKEINESISNKKDELDRIIEEERSKGSIFDDFKQEQPPKNQPSENMTETEFLFCANCGFKTFPQDKFCRQCGKGLSRE